MSEPRPDMPPFGESDLRDDPMALFAEWFERAESEVPLAEAVCVATVDEDGTPDARMVLLKGFDHRGFRFFTNERSEKGRQLEAAPSAALVLYWRELDRQVRIRGPVERLGAAESDEYFATRPRESRIGAWASPQSSPLAGRGDLEARVREAEERWDGDEVPRPPHWGGFRVVPDQIEFWQGQVGRLHDRFRYQRDAGGSWSWSRLAP
ncbi:MAG: pyridoxamine 5'-phosphate oxidase [Solirubrobacterales bacterium]